MLLGLSAISTSIQVGLVRSVGKCNHLGRPLSCDGLRVGVRRRLALDQAEDLMAKRRGAPRWARFLSWIVAAAVWLWVINVTIVQSSALANVSAEQMGTLALKIVFFVVVATALAASAMFLVRLIGRGLG